MELKKIILQRLGHVRNIAADADLREEIRGIPKYELHVHLGGSIRRETAVELAEKNGVPLPVPRRDFLSARSPLEFFEGAALWEHFHKAYMWHMSCLTTCDDVERVVFEFFEDSHAQGVIHSELTVSGSYLMNAFPFDEWTDAAGRGVKSAERKFGIRAAVLLDISRRFGAENALKTVEKLIDRRPACIAGIGMGGDEVKYPHIMFKEAFRLARENGIPSNVHVAEFCPGESVISALENLKPGRLGHALNVIRSKAAYDVLKRSGIHVESCPLCNYVGGMGIIEKLSDHPIRRYFLDGIPLSINTDDPRIFGFDLIDNYVCLMKELSFTLDEFRGINQTERVLPFLFKV